MDVRQGDAKATGLPRNAFDLATARLVLVNVPEPEAIVAEMAALDEFDGCRESLERHLADPDTVVMWAYFQAWATKP